MKVKRFCAPNNYEAMAQVKTELGAEAIILHQRKVKPKGIFGFFRKAHIEVVAAVEETPVRRNRIVETQKPINTYPVKTTNVTSSSTGVSTQIKELKDMLKVIVDKTNRDLLPDIIKNSNNPKIVDIYNKLANQNVEEAIADKILEELVNVSKKELDSKRVEELFSEKLREFLLDCVSIDNHDVTPKIIFFVGPTGVGKTTTIAKLAAKYSLEEGKSVGLISADTYRIAAVEQLKIYSDILNIPLEIIYNSSEIDKSLERLNKNDIIMVDTAGRNHNNDKQVSELKNLLNEVKEKDIYLTLSCTSSNNDLKEIINAYDFISDFKIILTKIDEASTYGAILNIATYTHKQLSYITTGQSVPDDIEIVTIDRIIALLTRGNGDE